MEEMKGGFRLIDEKKNELEKACLFENSDINMEDYVNKVNKIVKKANSFLSLVEDDYFYCPLCDRYYHKDKYKLKFSNVIKTVYMICPQGHSKGDSYGFDFDDY